MKLSERPFILSVRPESKFEDVPSDLCFDVINTPLTEIIVSKDLDEVIADLIDFNPDSIVLTSSIGSKILLEKTGREFLEKARFIFCIGSHTESVVKGKNTIVPNVGKRNVSGLLELILNRKDKTGKLAVFRSSEGNPFLMKGLLNSGLCAREFISYGVSEKGPEGFSEHIENEKFRGIVLTSPMEARIFSKIVASGPELKGEIFAIGEPTRNALETSGLHVSEPYGDSDFSDLMKKISEKYCKSSGEWI